MGPFPLSPREDGSPLTHPNQEVLETSAPPKDLQCPRSLVSLSSSSQKPFLIFLSRFTASLHCIYLAVPHASSLHLSPQCQGTETPKTLPSVHPGAHTGQPQGSLRVKSPWISLNQVLQGPSPHVQSGILSWEAAFGLGLEGCRMGTGSEKRLWNGEGLRSGKTG